MNIVSYNYRVRVCFEISFKDAKHVQSQAAKSHATAACARYGGFLHAWVNNFDPGEPDYACSTVCADAKEIAICIRALQRGDSDGNLRREFEQLVQELNSQLDKVSKWGTATNGTNSNGASDHLNSAEWESGANSI